MDHQAADDKTILSSRLRTDYTASRAPCKIELFALTVELQPSSECQQKKGEVAAKRNLYFIPFNCSGYGRVCRLA
jgi:hypothetical protein